MSSISFNRKKAKLKQLVGIRARLALLAVILVAPLMLERARSLESARAKEIALATAEFLSLAKHSADTQREVISSVETMLKSAAYIRASVEGISRSCDLLRASLPRSLPWIHNLLIADADGRVQCSANNTLIGANLSDRPYFKKAAATGKIVFSDFLFAKSTNRPAVIAAYPVSAIKSDARAFVIASVDLGWISKMMSNLGDRPGITAVLVDSAGTVLAAPPDQAEMIGRPLDSAPLLPTIEESALDFDRDEGSLSFVNADGSRHAVTFARIANTGSRLIASIDEDKVTAAINREIRTAYLQLLFVSLFVLLGALIAAQKLIIQPINMLAAMATRFGQGDWSARPERKRLPAEFVPLARAFNAMASELSQRERYLVATNDRLTVMASIDMLSGLANRRGFQSRLDFEWLKAQQHGCELSLLMIDVDHFKPYNDTYGHPAGDACLSTIGGTLDGIATETMGFAGRYGGEEFCLLLPNIDGVRARAIGEMVRSAIGGLALPHATSNHDCVTVSIGVACAKPSEGQCPSELIEAADAALYSAKRRGRNTVVEHSVGQMRDNEGSQRDRHPSRRSSA